MANLSKQEVTLAWTYANQIGGTPLKAKEHQEDEATSTLEVTPELTPNELATALASLRKIAKGQRVDLAAIPGINSKARKAGMPLVLEGLSGVCLESAVQSGAKPADTLDENFGKYVTDQALPLPIRQINLAKYISRLGYGNKDLATKAGNINLDTHFDLFSPFAGPNSESDAALTNFLYVVNSKHVSLDKRTALLQKYAAELRTLPEGEAQRKISEDNAYAYATAAIGFAKRNPGQISSKDLVSIVKISPRAARELLEPSYFDRMRSRMQGIFGEPKTHPSYKLTGEDIVTLLKSTPLVDRNGWNYGNDSFVRSILGAPPAGRQDYRETLQGYWADLLKDDSINQRFNGIQVITSLFGRFFEALRGTPKEQSFSQACTERSNKIDAAAKAAEEDRIQKRVEEALAAKAPPVASPDVSDDEAEVADREAQLQAQLEAASNREAQLQEQLEAARAELRELRAFKTNTQLNYVAMGGTFVDSWDEEDASADQTPSVLESSTVGGINPADQTPSVLESSTVGVPADQTPSADETVAPPEQTHEADITVAGTASRVLGALGGASAVRANAADDTVISDISGENSRNNVPGADDTAISADEEKKAVPGADDSVVYDGDTSTSRASFTSAHNQ